MLLVESNLSKAVGKIGTGKKWWKLEQKNLAFNTEFCLVMNRVEFGFNHAFAA